MKTFVGKDEHQYFVRSFNHLKFNNQKLYRMLFDQMIRIKPPASRKESTEIYYLGKQYKKGTFFREIAQADPKRINFEVFVEKYLNKVQTKEDKGFSSGLSIRETLKSMIHILKSSDIKRKICCLLLVFENDVLLLEAILYNPIADQIYISDGSRS